MLTWPSVTDCSDDLSSMFIDSVPTVVLVNAEFDEPAASACNNGSLLGSVELELLELESLELESLELAT